MKVLYLSVFHDGSGYSHAAIDFVLALDAAGVDVVPVTIKLNDLPFEVPDRIKELEKRSTSGASICIQHILPNFMEYAGAFKKNIALFELETDSFAHNVWPEHINLMDVGWLTSSCAEEACQKSGVVIPTTYIGHTSDCTKYTKHYKTQRIPSTDGNFIFYTICDMNNRKNLGAVLRAFHTEFDPTEPVSLVIKCSKFGLSNEQTIHELENFCAQIKQGIHIRSKIEDYKNEVLIPNVTTDEMIYGLHQSCDCYVSASCGEAWNISAFDAMAFGKTPILSDSTGHKDYMTNAAGWMVPCTKQVAFGGGGAWESCYTGYENWDAIDINKLRSAMREAYENEELREQKSAAGRKRAADFDLSVVGPKLKTLLESY